MATPTGIITNTESRRVAELYANRKKQMLWELLTLVALSCDTCRIHVRQVSKVPERYILYSAIIKTSTHSVASGIPVRLLFMGENIDAHTWNPQNNFPFLVIILPFSGLVIEV